jgi:hypothetical protein
MARRSKPTKKKRAEFLELLADTGIVSKATKALNLDRRRMYELRDEDPEFREAWDQALETAADTIEAEARRRAFDGVDEPVFYQGEEVAIVKRYSDNLLMFLLKGNRPDKFKERFAGELTGKDGGAVQVAITRTIIRKGDET